MLALLAALVVAGGIIWFFVQPQHTDERCAARAGRPHTTGSAAAQPAAARRPRRPTTPVATPAQPRSDADHVARNLESAQEAAAVVDGVGDRLARRRSLQLVQRCRR